MGLRALTRLLRDQPDSADLVAVEGRFQKLREAKELIVKGMRQFPEGHREQFDFFKSFFLPSKQRLAGDQAVVEASLGAVANLLEMNNEAVAWAQGGSEFANEFALVASAWLQASVRWLLKEGSSAGTIARIDLLTNSVAKAAAEVGEHSKGIYDQHVAPVVEAAGGAIGGGDGGDGDGGVGNTDWEARMDKTDQYIRKDSYGKAYRFGTDESTAVPFDQATVEEAQGIFGQPEVEQIWSPPSVAESAAFGLAFREACSSDKLRECIKNLPKAAATGAGGFGVDLLWLVAASKSERVIEALAVYVVDFATGRVAPFIRSLLAGGQVACIPKADGSGRRFVVPQAPLVKIIEHIVLDSMMGKDVCCRLAGEHQYCLMKSGVDLVVEAVQYELSQRPDNVALTMDIASAYPSVKRALLLAQLRASGDPAQRVLAMHVYYMFQSSPIYQVRTVVGPAQLVLNCGLPQGGVSSSVMLAVLTAPVYERVQREFAHLGASFFAFVDDSNAVAPIAVIPQVGMALVNGLAAIGLNVKPSKTKLLLQAALEPGGYVGAPLFISIAGQVVPVIGTQGEVASAVGLRCLGQPIGTVEFELEQMQRVVEELCTDLDSLMLATSSYQQFNVLVRIVWLAKRDALFKMAPFHVRTTEMALKLDRKLLSAFAGMMGESLGNLEPDVILSMQDPFSAGGLSLSMAGAANYAYVLGGYANMMRAVPTNSLASARLLNPCPVTAARLLASLRRLRVLAEIAGDSKFPVESLPPEGDLEALLRLLATDKSVSVRNWRGYHERLCMVAAKGRISNNPALSVAEKAKLMAMLVSNQQPSSYLWLTMPNLDVHLALCNVDFGCALAYRIGVYAPVFGVDGGLIAGEQCACQLSQINFLHAAGCMATGCSTVRHNGIVDTVAKLMRRLGGNVTTEPRKVVPDDPGGNGRRGKNRGVDLQWNHRGDIIAADFTVVNPASTAVAVEAAKTPFYACAVATAVKLAKYGEAHEARGIDLYVPAMETSGAMGPGVGKFLFKIKKIIKAKDLSASMPISYLLPSYTVYMRRALSVSAVAGTAQAMRGCFRQVLDGVLARAAAHPAGHAL